MCFLYLYCVVDTLPTIFVFLLIRLVPVSSNKNGVGKEKEDFDCLLSVWRPQEQLQEVKEGTVMKFSGLTATPSKYVVCAHVRTCACYIA